jgi:hypothetical protein
MLEKLAMNKHSISLRKVVNYRRKKIVLAPEVDAGSKVLIG